MFSKFNSYTLRTMVAIMVISSAAAACTMQRKVNSLRTRQVKARLELPSEPDAFYGDTSRTGGLAVAPDTIVYQDFEGRDVIVMSAVRDESTGEMIASDVIEAAHITARFRNVVERRGSIDIVFQLVVPQEMLDSKWQLRFYPTMDVMGDMRDLDDVYITGNGYRRAQLKGYQRYERFVKSIITDSTRLMDRRQLEIYIERNIPELYAFRLDSTAVSEEEFYGAFGVSHTDAVEHYTDRLATWINNWRIRNKGRMYARYVKAPIVDHGLRLDTIVVNPDGDLVYDYVQTIPTQPKLRKVDVYLTGEIYDQDVKVYDIPRGDSLCFYISSLSSFVDNTPRYLTHVVERRAEANASYYITFEQGRDAVKESLGSNASEMALIREHLTALMDNTTYDLDSITVMAAASPEGSAQFNMTLSHRRAESVVQHFVRMMKAYSDSVYREAAVSIDFETGAVRAAERLPVIPMRPSAIGEKWDALDDLVCTDPVLSDADRESYFRIRDEKDPDRREHRLKAEKYYPYMLKSLYPALRTVDFAFHLHRKGMVKDTVHTTVLDTTYMDGVQAIRDRDYERAVTLLRPYGDYNTAVAYCCLGYDTSALSILETLPRVAEVDYMLAVIYSRKGRMAEAVQCYMDACAKNSTFVHRGNLDPEISVLIKTYGLNKEDDIPTDF